MGTVKKSLIEGGFPFDDVSRIAEQESWRKDINRPTSYIHKWWARRLGSVFRSLIIGGTEPESTDFFEKYYTNTTYKDLVVFDPFMGSGTTITEAVKFGAKVVGADINPVACAMVRTALEKYDREEVIKTYNDIQTQCEAKIKKYYRAKYEQNEVDVLYYFWVKTVHCDDCGYDIPLFKSTVFSKNAYPSRKPLAQSVCPNCGNINQIMYDDLSCLCARCHEEYNPQKGNVKGIEYVCPRCGKHEKIVDYARRTGRTIPERMYAKMVLGSDGKKHYLDVDKTDVELYQAAADEVEKYVQFIPNDCIKKGVNTNQILNYQYRQWKEMFNERQLMAFGVLVEAISRIENFELRRLFAVLMSGTLEFNNMFCSFKGEGTGAVRPLFYNHILKNELMPLEANVWGLKGASGSFSTLFETRVLRMIEYKEKPFELKLQQNGSSQKVFLEGCSIEVSSTELLEKWSEERPLIYCKDSAHINLPDASVDLVVTDPPFFDNVNYSELADFFYIWLRKMNVGVGNDGVESTRQNGEVQDNDPNKFSLKLKDVFTECNRLLKPDGKLIFTYHHARTDGWTSVYNAICGAGYTIIHVIPIKAEMAVSVAIISAKTPINYDLIFVCRKTSQFEQIKLPVNAENDYKEIVEVIERSRLKFSDGDRMILKYGLALKQLSEMGKINIKSEDIDQVISDWQL